MKYLITLCLLLVPTLAMGQEEVSAEKESSSPPIIYGVRLESELPLDASVVEFVANPIGYAASNVDTFALAGFIERGRLGAEVTLRSGLEASFALYYVTSAGYVFGIGQESSVGIRVGQRDGEFFARLQLVVQVYGIIH